MTISADVLRDIIRFSLRPMDKWSPEAEELLMMIAAHESQLGKELRQIGGPARGIYQMEPETEKDIWETYLKFRPGLVQQVSRITGVNGPDENHLQYNPIYSTIMARLKLWRAPERLPSAHDVDAMSLYAKDYYNSRIGKATPEKYSIDYCRLVLS